METYEEFVEFLSRPGAKATIKLAWMKKGCPTCHSKKWQVTNDGWAYCEGCSRGFPTDFIMTNQPIETVDFGEVENDSATYPQTIGNAQESED